MARHRRRLGILWMVYAVFPLFFGIWMVYATMILPQGQLSHWEEGIQVPATPFENALPAVVSVLVFVWGIVSLMAGWGLLERTSWGRKLAVVVGIFSLFSIFFGTALGIYTLCVLMGRDAKREYVET